MKSFTAYKSLVLVLVLALILQASGLASAAAIPKAGPTDGIERFKKPMPPVDLLPEQQFLEMTQEHSAVPYGDKSLAYSLRWPKTWSAGEEKSSSNFELNTKLFTSINIWYSPPRMGGQSRIEVKAVDLEFQLTAEQWFLRTVLESGQTLEGFTVHSDKKVEALMIVMEEDTSYYVRTVTILNGKRVLQAQYFVPMLFWGEERAMQAQCLSSFNVTYPTESMIENMLAFQFLDVAEVKYPESWKARAKPLTSVEHMNVKFLNIRETKSLGGRIEESIEGQVDATLVSAETSESLINELETYKKSLEGTGMLLGKKLENREDYAYSENFSFALTEVYEGIDSTNDSMEYELWVSVMVSGGYYYFVSLLTPSRNESYFTWARNTQTYKQIVQGTAPSAGGFLDKADDL